MKNKKMIIITAAAVLLSIGSFGGYKVWIESPDVEPFALEDSELEVFTTEDGVEYVITPDEYFEDLHDWPYELQYVEIDGLRQAYYEAGPADGEVILLLHGQPTWSYLYRKLIPPLADAGYRVIAMDHLGMGRSDKPIDLEYYSYMLHVERLEAFIQKLDLDDEGISVFLQDWGSVIGLNVVGNHPDWFDRVILGNGSLPEWSDDYEPIPSIETYTQKEIQNSLDLINSKIAQAPAVQPQRRDENGELLNNTNGGHDLSPIRLLYIRTDERFRVSANIEAGTNFALTPEELAAFEAPFPARITMASTRMFPSLISDLPGKNDSAWEGLRNFEKPFLTIIGNNDTGSFGSVENQNNFIDNIPGAKGQPHARLMEAGHFVQYDQGTEVARIVLEFMAANPVD